MAKISTYPGPSTPSLSDMLIGTDVNDMNATKNFTIGDILSVSGSSVYVPYIGAINNVNLGTYNLLTDEINPVNDIFIIQDFFQSYGGVKLDYTLGVIKYYFGDFDVRSSGLALIIDEVNSTLKIGYNNYITINDALNRIELSGSLYTNGSVGSSGQILTSQGAGLSPTWALPNFVPYTGATGDVNLGFYKLTTYALRVVNDECEITWITPNSTLNNFFMVSEYGYNGKIGLNIDFINDEYSIGDLANQVNGTYLKVDDANSRIEISNALYTNGSVGSTGDVLVSQGAGLPAQWTSALAPVYGSFYDVNSQTTLGNTEELMQFGTTDMSIGVTIVNNGLGDPTRITVASTGVYNIQFSAQLTKTGGSTGDVYIYLKKNGIIVPDSNTKLTLANNGHYVVASWNFFVQLNAGQYAEIAWYSTNANIELHYDAIPVVGLPAIPSIILTVNKVG